MISSGIGYVLILLAIISVVLCSEKYAKLNIFKWAPSFVIIYLFVMLLTPFQLWQWNEDVTQTYKTARNTILPSMIFLMLLNANFAVLAKLGFKLIFTFFLASLSIGVAVVLTHTLFSGVLPQDSWMTFATLTGSWMGGTTNMLAIQSSLNIPEEAVGYALIIDSVDYGMWVMLLLFLVPFADKFNHWTKANVDNLQSVGNNTDVGESKNSYDVTDHLLLISLGLGVTWLSQTLAPLFPEMGLFGQSSWVVIIATVLGLMAAQTPLRHLLGKEQLANQLLLLMIALIASRADLSSMTNAPVYVLAGAVILLLHGGVMLLAAKLFRLDLFSCGIASLANVGGIASAPILASAYGKALIPVGVLMAILGYVVGTFGGLVVAQIIAG